MSGWIKMGTGLASHGKVKALRRALKGDRLKVIGGLWAVWCVFDEHSAGGFLAGYTLDDMDEEIGWKGFSAAMRDIGWLIETDDGLEGEEGSFTICSFWLVSALVEIGEAAEPLRAVRARPTDEQFRAFFEPKGVLIAGASTHPGKFGFVSLHNLLANGFAGGVYGTNLQGEDVLGVQTVADIEQLPAGAIDLVFVCTPASANPALLRACAAKGVKAAFLTSAGYGEAGEEGRAAEADLVALADELGILLAGPNGQGVVSTPANLCAQIVAPYPPAGRIAVASQSGNFVSSFLNYARQTGVGISRAVSAGNAAAVTPADYLDFYADDAATAVSLAYVEGIVDGRGRLKIGDAFWRAEGPDLPQGTRVRVVAVDGTAVQVEAA